MDYFLARRVPKKRMRCCLDYSSPAPMGAAVGGDGQTDGRAEEECVFDEPREKIAGIGLNEPHVSGAGTCEKREATLVGSHNSQGSRYTAPPQRLCSRKTMHSYTLPM